MLFFIHVVGLSSLFSVEREKYLHFTDIDGLPRNITTCIEQDKYGYTWIGTGNGIARYDGNSFYNYKQLSGQNINYLFIDSKNQLWVATDLGLYFYNRQTDFFEIRQEGYIRKIQEDNGMIYFLNVDRIQRIEGNTVVNIRKESDFRDLCITTKGIWFSHSLDGVKLLSRQSGFKEVTENYLENKYVSVIRKIDGYLFFGCRNGMLFVRSSNGTQKKLELNNHRAFQEIVKVDNEIWLATDGNGIIVLDENLNYLRSLIKSDDGESKLTSNSIYDIYQGANDEIWIATYGGGLQCVLADVSPFKNIVPVSGNKNSLVGNEGVSVFSNNSKIYYGTNYGLSVFDEKTEMFTNLTSNDLNNDLLGVKVLAVNTDSDDNLWIGTYDGLLGKYTPDYHLKKRIHPCSKAENEMQRIVLMHKYDDRSFLLGTQYRDKSLLNFDIESQKISTYKVWVDRKNISHFQIISIRENQEGETIVLIRNAGLFTVKANTTNLVDELPEINKRITFKLNDFYHDKKGFYWMTSQTNGLIRMSVDGRVFDKWTIDDGLPSNTLLRLESVDDRFLWISTIAGLCRFDMETSQILIFNHQHGLAANEFMPRSSTTTADGRLIFGSSAGFTIVDPQKVQPDISETKVIISDITFHNKSIKSVTDKQYLSVPLEETKELCFPFRRNSFTIHFFSKDNDLPKYNNYAYRLKGLEDNWIYLGETKHTTYTNLSHGTYVFEVKSTNKSNVWSNQPTQLIIKINPPWYLSLYAYSGYFIFIVSVVFGSSYIYTNRIHLKKEVEISEFKVKAEHELTEKKLAFFTNVSHDLKTPLTLIDAPLDDLISAENLDEEQRNKLNVIRRNSRRLYKLISDLLDFRKLTQNQLPLKVCKTNVHELIENVYSAFKEECKIKAIDLEKSIHIESEVYIDSRKIEKILWNLLSNAIKFTEEEGEIFLCIDSVPINGINHLKILVKDSGIGISDQNKEKIFNRFYQVETSNNAPEGTGIGLSIVKDLVDLHHGTIELQSTPGVGSSFIVTIPSEINCYSEDEIDLEIRKRQELFKNDPRSPILPDEDERNKHARYNLPKLLLAEDNTELLEYLGTHFGKNYKVYKAPDGLIGLKLAKEKNPDIIVTDVLMPNMNGYEFCSQVKQQFETSHIPVVMLTANSSTDQQIEGLTKGADAYVTKPFDIRYLDTVINSVLENRKKLREKFVIGIEISNLNQETLPLKDVEFINSVKAYIDENLSDQVLNIENLADKFAISRTQLFRKIKSLTGQTPNNLIKTIRLKRAYELIKKQGVRVSEAAYQTGFSDPNYFTICFKKEFGENPSQII